MNDWASLAYLIAAICFIVSLRSLASPETARRGNIVGMSGITIAIVTTLFLPAITSYGLIITALIIGGTIGTIIALKINMTALPQLVAFFHSLVGLAAVLVALTAFIAPDTFGINNQGGIHWSSLVEMSLGAVIGAVTFTGSIVAFGKLQGIFKSAPLVFPMQHNLNALIGCTIIAAIILFSFSASPTAFAIAIILSLCLGVLLIAPVGGADMPVVVSMLNSYSGWAAAGIGFTLANIGLIITGALVGASGAILSYIMCRGMNRSILNVLLGGIGNGQAPSAENNAQSDKNFNQGNAEDAAFIMKNASSMIIIPGYGMAVAQAQHALREISDVLKEHGVKVRYAIHPVAGRMPGHMNVLLAEASVSYEDVIELEEINRDFAQTDIALVIGANDVTNPSAKTDTQSPIYGMPILDAEKARTILFIKRSLASGYAGVDNPLFYKENTLMLFGDAKKMCETILKALN